MNQNAIKGRIESLDWLRGLMATAIMFYHLIYWHIAPIDSSYVLGRLGVYGVSIFFVLSGLSMAIVYSSFIVDRRTAVVFYIRRIFRIWPLLWLCLALVVLPSLLKGNDVSIQFLLLNITTLFGFVSPSSYINTGAWSIGNEMVYYAMTPFLLMSYEKSRSIGNILLVLSLLVALLFAFVLLDSQRPLAEQWRIYINPFNNVFLYIAGISIYYNLRYVEMRTTMLGLLFAFSIALFVFYPATGDQIAITTGVNRIVFLLASVVLVCAFYKFSNYSIVPKRVQYALGQLGIATYGVYLLHPIINSYAGYALNKLGFHSAWALIAFVPVLTVIFAIVSFRVFELKIMQYGKAITSNGGSVWPGFGHVPKTPPPKSSENHS